MSDITVLPPAKVRRTEKALKRFQEERRKLALSGHDPDDMLYHLGHFLVLLSLEDGKTGRFGNE